MQHCKQSTDISHLHELRGSISTLTSDEKKKRGEKKKKSTNNEGRIKKKYSNYVYFYNIKKKKKEEKNLITNSILSQVEALAIDHNFFFMLSLGFMLE